MIIGNKNNMRDSMEDCEIIQARGHENIRSTHKTTIEFTKEDSVTKRGDCIVAVSASKACNELPERLKKHLREGGAISVKIECDGISDVISAYGHEDLTLESKREIVVRKSNFIDNRTLAVGADKAAKDLKRNLVKKIQEGREIIIKIIY